MSLRATIRKEARKKEGKDEKKKKKIITIVYEVPENKYNAFFFFFKLGKTKEFGAVVTGAAVGNSLNEIEDRDTEDMFDE